MRIRLVILAGVDGSKTYLESNKLTFNPIMIEDARQEAHAYIEDIFNNLVERLDEDNLSQ